MASVPLEQADEAGPPAKVLAPAGIHGRRLRHVSVRADVAPFLGPDTERLQVGARRSQPEKQHVEERLSLIGGIGLSQQTNACQQHEQRRTPSGCAPPGLPLDSPGDQERRG